MDTKRDTVEPVIAPAKRQRLTEATLTANGSLVLKNHQNILQIVAGTLMKAKDLMLQWLLQRGVRLDKSSTYDGVALQQFILFWFMAEHDPNFQLQIRYSQPLLFFRQMKTDGEIALMTAEELPGKCDFQLLEEGEVRPVLAFNRLPRYLRPKGLTTEQTTIENLTKKFLNIDGEYDAAWATVVRRWDLMDIVNGESTGPSNIYATFVIAHELTHMEQWLYRPLFPHLCNLIQARTRFRLWVVDQNTPLYRFDQNPDQAHSNIQVGYRNLEGNNPIGRLTEDDQRWEYLGIRRANPNVLDDRLQTCIDICQKYGMNVTNGVCVRDFFRKMKKDITTVAQVLDNISGSVSPFTDLNWVQQFAALQMYLFQNDGDGSTLSGCSDVIPGCKYEQSKSLTKAVIELIQADTVTFNVIERNRVVIEITTITGLGISYVNAAIPVFNLYVNRSIQMQKQCITLFPSLLGCFTGYSNEYFRKAVTETKERLSLELQSKTGSALANYLPKPVLELFVKLKIGLDLISKPNNIEKITLPQWYQLGAPLGFFNAYTREFDAEGRAMWICCPEELVDMYRRAKWKIEGTLREEILNQATYISVRGFFEEGDVPKYTD